MRAKSMVLIAAAALVVVPATARADGSGGGAEIIPISVLASIELGLLAGGTTVALGSRATARSEHPNRTWYTWSYVLGGVNLVIGGAFGAAFVDACIKVLNHDPNYLGRSVWSNGLNAWALGLGIAHLAVAGLDLGFAIAGSTKRDATRVSVVPVILGDRASHPVTGLAIQIDNF
jgi:hypothetical protein